MVEIYEKECYTLQYSKNGSGFDEKSVLINFFWFETSIVIYGVKELNKLRILCDGTWYFKCDREEF